MANPNYVYYPNLDVLLPPGDGEIVTDRHPHAG